MKVALYIAGAYILGGAAYAAYEYSQWDKPGGAPGQRSAKGLFYRSAVWPYAVYLQLSRLRPGSAPRMSVTNPGTTAPRDATVRTPFGDIRVTR